MKLFFLLTFVSCSFFMGQDFLYALEDWYQPQIHSRVYGSFCEEPVPNPFGIPEFYGEKTSFAVSSLKSFKQSVQRYFSPMDCDGIFFRYVPIALTGKDTIFHETDWGEHFHCVPTYPKQDLLIRILGGIDYQQNEYEHYFFLYKGLKLQAMFSPNVSINGYWWAGQFRGDRNYYLQSTLIDGFYQPKKDVTYLDNLQGSLKYDTDKFQISLGRGKYQVGDNISGSIILNNISNDYGYISSKLQFGTLSLSYLHGALTPDKSETMYFHDNGSDLADSVSVDKFIVMHKLDWSPTSYFSGFIGEEIIYGNRSFDLNYLMPHTFWRIIEHNLEDRDNVLIFGGFKWNLSPYITVYQNTLFDEFSKSKILTDWWGSKYALQTGISFLRKGTKNHSEKYTPRITLEMTAIRPWTYTHFIKWNKFSQDGIALGYPTGSNCLNYSAEVDFPIPHRVFIGFNVSYSRQGSTGNRFDLNTSNPELIPDTQNTKTKWLAGRITDTKKVNFMAEWTPLAHHFFRIGTTIIQQDESDWTQDLVFSYRTEF